MAAKIPAHVREQQINDLPNIQFVRWVDTYKNSGSRAVCRCAIDGCEWAVPATNLVNARTGCPRCACKTRKAKNRKWTAEERIAQINARPNIEFVRWVDGYKNAFSKAVFRCTIDSFEWPAQVDSLVNGGFGCPQCAGNRRWTAEERIAQINGKSNIYFVNWVGKYTGAETKAVCHCTLDGFEWAASVTSLVHGGSGCPQCAGQRRWTEEENIAQINALKNISFIRWEDGYKGRKSKAVCRCAVDGFEWPAAVDSLVSARTGCPQCSGKRKWTAEERIAQINARPNIEFVRWADGYKNAFSKAVCRCAVDGFEWCVTVSGLLHAGSGCPLCSGARRWTAEERIAQINAAPNISFVRWADKFAGAHSKAICKCAVDGCEWAATVTSLVHGGSGCPQCHPGGYSPDRRGTLYILRSECGTMVKIGISNRYKTRFIKLERSTPFKWHCIELIHSNDGSLIAEWEKELHSWTEQAELHEPFHGYTEWRKWDDRLPRWLKRYRARLNRLDKNRLLEKALLI